MRRYLPIVLTGIVYLSSATLAKADERLQAGGLASKEDLRKLSKAVLALPIAQSSQFALNKITQESLEANKVMVAAELNKTLGALHLPLINSSSPDFKISVATENTFAGSIFAGLTVVDGKNRFCLPCQVGWNNFTWGITSFVTGNRKPNGRFYGALKCFEALDPLITDNQNRVNASNLPKTRFIAIPGSESARDGFYVVTDENIYFYPADLPDGSDSANANKTYGIKLPSGQSTKVSLFYSSKDDLVYASEVSMEAESVRDLGIGAGDKVTDSAIKALQREARSQLSNLAVPDSDWTKPGSALGKLGCSALAACRNEKTLDSKKVEDNISEATTALHCSGSAPPAPEKTDASGADPSTPAQ